MVTLIITCYVCEANHQFLVPEEDFLMWLHDQGTTSELFGQFEPEIRTFIECQICPACFQGVW